MTPIMRPIAFLFSLVALLGGCHRKILMEELPRSFTLQVFDQGKLTTTQMVSTGDPAYEAIRAILIDARKNWMVDMRTYAPSMIFRSEAMTINCLSDGVIVNIHEPGSSRRFQIAAAENDCRSTIMRSIRGLPSRQLERGLQQ